MAFADETICTLVDRRGTVANRDVVRALGVSPATAHRLLQRLARRGVLQLSGKGPASQYRFRPVRRRFKRSGLEEDRAWNGVAEAIARIRSIPQEESRSLQYAATEVINNAVEHSRGSRVTVAVDFAAVGSTVTRVQDDGVGVFRRVCEDFGFSTPEEAIVQLEKGKLTSDPEQHSGEGLFFSSKAVARFRLESQGIAWIVDSVVGDSAVAGSAVRRGTSVTLDIVRGHTPLLEDIFRAYTDAETLRFTRTRTTVKLSVVGSALVSRSEAKRIVAGLTKFKHVTLDFSGAEVVGQGFCDEVFRVFARAHTQVILEPVGMNAAVGFMVARALAT